MNPSDEKLQEISQRITSGDFKQQIMPHQHFYQVQASDTCIVRWCTGCGETHMVTRYHPHGEWESCWKKIKDK